MLQETSVDFDREEGEVEGENFKKTKKW